MSPWSPTKKVAQSKPPFRRPSRSVVGARHLHKAKWFVPGLMEVANDRILPLVGSSRARCSRSSAETPWARQRLVAAKPLSLIAFYFSCCGVFCKEGLIFKS
jgi:hypothetical protein